MPSCAHPVARSSTFVHHDITTHPLHVLPSDRTIAAVYSFRIYDSNANDAETGDLAQQQSGHTAPVHTYTDTKVTKVHQTTPSHALR